MCSIASGSSGNCVYVGSQATHLLVDTGISGKRVEQGLKGLDLSPKDLDGILITHEHADHISGLGVITRKYEIPVYATEGTIKAMLESGSLGKVEESLFHPIKEDEKFILKDLTINPMHISHDAVQPVAYRISYGNKRVGICTDLGVYNDYTVECLRNLDLLYLEANHDVHMLQVGPYPYYLKQRILGERGHLSNEAAGKLLSRLLHDGMQAVVLGHLSKENNLPELAYESVRVEVTMSDTKYNGNDFPMYVAKRDEVSEMIELR